nr:MAG TPA: hypothetical protein [Caudoviricetes sp.]
MCRSAHLEKMYRNVPFEDRGERAIYNTSE